jgi:hypothetical protein
MAESSPFKRDTLAFFRILPAGAADIGDDVTREDLRQAGVGDWAMTGVGADDLSDVGGLFGGEYDEPVPLDTVHLEPLPMEDAPTAPRVPFVELKLGKAG